MTAPRGVPGPALQALRGDVDAWGWAADTGRRRRHPHSEHGPATYFDGPWPDDDDQEDSAVTDPSGTTAYIADPGTEPPPAGVWRPIGLLNEPGIQLAAAQEGPDGDLGPVHVLTDYEPVSFTVSFRAAPRGLRWLRRYTEGRPVEQLPKLHPAVKATGRHRGRVAAARRDSRMVTR